MKYKNSAKDADKRGVDKSVELSLFELTFGKWSDESCIKLGLIACQKKQIWDINGLKKTLENLTSTLVKMQSQNEKFEK